MKEIPAVSVIVPLYNAEKFIGKCLDSILEQTFQDFEVIVADDCSTDSSPEIAQSYVEKFGGRMTFKSLINNSGNDGYTARNKGFNRSHGEYVYFMNANSFLTKTALEELYTAAKKYDADVIYTSAHYVYTDEGAEKLNFDAMGATDKPFLLLNTRQNNLEDFLKIDLFAETETKFVRRDFLMENEISFYELPCQADFVWTLELFACAEKLLIYPNPIYFRHDESLSKVQENEAVDEQIYAWSKEFFYLARALSASTGRRDLLKENPLYCHKALSRHFEYYLSQIKNVRAKVKPEQICEILRREFSKGELKDKHEYDLMIPFFFSLIDFNERKLIQSKKRIEDLKIEIEQTKLLNLSTQMTQIGLLME